MTKLTILAAALLIALTTSAHAGPGFNSKDTSFGPGFSSDAVSFGPGFSDTNFGPGF